MKPGIWGFMKTQWTPQPPVVQADLTGKTILVTGANTGLGFEAAQHFARMNPGRVIMACRSQSKGQAALEKLKAVTGYDRAELWIVDLADFESVKKFAGKCEQDGGRLDILIANAGIVSSTYDATKDGWESSVQVNHLAPSLLIFLLLPAMFKTAEEHKTVPRIVVVSSMLHYFARIEKPVVESPEIIKTIGKAEYCTPKAMGARYPLTKLLNVFFVRALNARLPSSSSLVVNAVSPGFCHSELVRTYSGLRMLIDRFMKFVLAFTAEVGSRQLVWAALAQEDHPEEIRGQYIAGSRVQEVSDFVLSPEGCKAQDLIWEDTLDILSKVDDKVKFIVDKYL
ncbi:hypothetical protein FB45DRAFT_114778 [Roridomyces roridus]|uniref:NAD(P)-binding protein n=1 Tax=Roridomyces roridus TaxID=1738132 RepID=A0AAD7BKY0_9AGAR|nr:hypothetical protein FB45DRAFT_114778 [Roridomyces roridus]